MSEKQGFALAYKPSRPAFTLLEMIIVISIVGLIAGISVGSYGAIRKQAKLDIAVDGLVTAFKEQSQKATSGIQMKTNTASPAIDTSFWCFGLRFSKEEPYVSYRSAPYINADDFRADVCDDQKLDTQKYDFLEEVILKKIVVDRQGLQSELENTDVFFKPPFAKPLVLSEQNLPKDIFKLILVVGLTGSEEERTIEFDSLTGNAKRILNIQAVTAS